MPEGIINQLDDNPNTIGSTSLVKGTNQLLDGHELEETEAEHLINVDVSQPTRIRKRKGYTIVGDDTANEAIVGMGEFRPTGSAPIVTGKQMFCFCFF